MRQPRQAEFFVSPGVYPGKIGAGAVAPDVILRMHQCVTLKSAREGSTRGSDQCLQQQAQIDSTRLIFPGLAGLYESVAPYSYSIIRFIAGAILVYHGYGKLFGGIIQGVADHVVTPLGLPAPLAWAYFLGGLEFFGGIALAIGLLDAADRADADGRVPDHHLLALSERLQLFEPERRLRISAGAADPLRGDLLPRRRPAVGRQDDRQEF